MNPQPNRLEVLMVSSARDLEIAGQSLVNLNAYMPFELAVTLVTDEPNLGRAVVERVGLDVDVLGDASLLSAHELRLPGWYRQQVVKLRVGHLVSGERFCVMSGDALLARRIRREELYSDDGRAILHVNRYRYPAAHLDYERRRVRAVASLLGVRPGVSLMLGDFITDLFCFERPVLEVVEERLRQRHGAHWTKLLDGRSTRPRDQVMFGEYTLYSVAALEIVADPPPTRISWESHVLQLHSRRAFDRATFDSAIVHVVDKGISLTEVIERAATLGRDLRPDLDPRTSS